MDYDIGFNNSTSKSGAYPIILFQLIRQYSSTEDKLSMKEIEKVLEEFWRGDKELASCKKNIRRTIKRNLVTIMLLDPNIHAERSDGTEIDTNELGLLEGDETEHFLGTIKNVWYDQSLSYTDLQFLTDAVINSKHLTNTKRREILDKLFNATGTTYATQTAWYKMVLSDAEERSVPVSIDLYRNLEFINTAINEKMCISFNYCYSGPRNEKYTVKSYNNVSPYKIILENGTYYMIASSPEESSSKNSKNAIFVTKVHKLDCISTDINSKFVPLEKTYAADWTIEDIMINHIRQGCFMFFFGRTAAEGIAELKVNAEGLDILIDEFGNRVTKIQRIYDTDSDLDETTPELKYMYQLTLTNMFFNEWDELALLKIKYPNQIRILEPSDLLEGIIHQINYIDENYPDGEVKND